MKRVRALSDTVPGRNVDMVQGHEYTLTDEEYSRVSDIVQVIGVLSVDPVKKEAKPVVEKPKRKASAAS